MFPHDFFWSCQTTKLRQIVIPLFSNFFSDTRAFLKHKGSHYETFLYSGTEKVSPENRGTPLSYPQFFSCAEIFWKTKVFPHDVFRHCETKKFPRKIVVPPFFIRFFIYIPEIFGKTDFPPQRFSATWDKKLSTENRGTLLLSFFFHSRIFLKKWKVPLRTLSAQWERISMGKCDTQNYA